MLILADFLIGAIIGFCIFKIIFIILDWKRTKYNLNAADDMTEEEKARIAALSKTIDGILKNNGLKYKFVLHNDGIIVSFLSDNVVKYSIFLSDREEEPFIYFNEELFYTGQDALLVYVLYTTLKLKKDR